MVLTGPENDTRGVSPVVGVALLVAITVILAATVGTFLLSTDVQEPKPDVDFTVSEERDNGNITSVTFAHNGVEVVDGDQLRVVYTGDAVANDTIDDSRRYSAGDSFVIEFKDDEDDQGEQLRIIWDAEGGDQGEILHEHTLTNDVAD